MHGRRTRIAPALARTFQYSGLYGWWKLDEGRATWPWILPATGITECCWAARRAEVDEERRGTALSFDGVDAYVETDTFLPNLAMPFSISLWVNPAATQVEHADILGNHGEPYRGHQPAAGRDKDQLVRVRLRRRPEVAGNGSRAARSRPMAAPGRGLRRRELDPVRRRRGEKPTAQGKGPLAANRSQNFKLGQGYHSGRYFRGLLSDVRIYRHALSPAEVSQLTKKTSPFD